MFDFQFLGKSLIGFGVIITLIGVLVFFSDKIPFIGRLPGDIYIKRENFSFYFPLATGLLLSLVISLILWLFRK
jgi:hypothetical protein